MKLLVSLVAVMLVSGAVAGERCGCNKPNVNKPKQTVAAPVKQQPTPRQCAAAKPCAQRPVVK
jgi:hypothetical protein